MFVPPSRSASRAAVAATLVLAVAPLAAGRGEQRTAEADDLRIYTTIDNDGLLAIMKEEGYSASINEKGTLIWKLEGYRAQVFVSRESGSNVQFHISFKDANATPKKVNDWNAKRRYSRTYLDDDGDPHLELDLDLEGGVTRARIVDFLVTCRVSTTAWCKHVVE